MLMNFLARAGLQRATPAMRQAAPLAQILVNGNGVTLRPPLLAMQGHRGFSTTDDSHGDF